MKKLKKIISICLAVILFVTTINLSNAKAHAQEDITKVNRFFSADQVVSGTTTPNTRIKYTGINNSRGGDTYGVFSAVSNNEGVFKIYVGHHNANTTFTINTYDSNGELMDSDEVFVLKASLEAYFSINFYGKPIYDTSVFDQTPIERPTANIDYSATQGSKIEVMVDDIVLKTDIAAGPTFHQSLSCPEIQLGDFVKVRVSKGSLVKTYELLATPYDVSDTFSYSFNPIYTSKITTWSDSISIYLPSNLKYSGLFNKEKDLIQIAPSGVVQQTFDEHTTLKDLKPITLYESQFENVVNFITLPLSTSPKPVIDPVSQVSKEVTGTATANSLITILDEQDNKIGGGMTNENGRFDIPVNQLIPDTRITVETRMPNTALYDYSYSSVEEVYIDELSDNSSYLTGQSSFGSNVEVFLLETNSTPTPNTFNMNTLSSNKASQSGLSVASFSVPNTQVNSFAPKVSTLSNTPTVTKKSIGKFTIKKGSEFKLNIGKQKANSTIQIVLKDYNKSLTLPEKKVKDKTAPVISNVKNNGLYRVDVIPSFNEGSATLDGKSYLKGTKITKEGTHKLIVKDNAGNSSTIIFTIDKTAPSTPYVYNVKYSSASISGKGEKGATIFVYKGKEKIGYTTVNSRGTFNLKIKKQKKGTVLTVYSIDKAGNKSKSRKVKVN